MKTIWKFALDKTKLGFHEIEVPEESKFLTAREQNGEVCVWLICDPKKKTELRKIAVVGTGQPLDDSGEYIGTVFLYGGAFVLHVFEVLSDD